MLAMLFLLLTIVFGISIATRFIDIKKIYCQISGKEFGKNLPLFLFNIPAGIIIGIMFTTFMSYFIIYFLNMIKCQKISFPLGLMITSLILFVCSIINIKKIKRNKNNSILFYLIIMFLIFIFTCIIMFISLKMVNGNLIYGNSSSFDLFIHTSHTASFGIGGNVPTQYTYFGGAGIKWHFMFYFFCGITNYLGFPLDYAINIPSILSMFSFLSLLGLVAVLLSRKKISFLLTIILVLFRSGYDIVVQIGNLINKNIPILDGILKNNTWIYLAPSDDWGMYSINIFMLQRHLMIAIGCMAIIVILFMPYVKQFIAKISKKKYKKFKNKIKYFFLHKDNWKFDWKDKHIIIVILLLLCLPYFHGSALISILLILFVFALFSENRLTYLLVAISSIIFSYLQTRLFSGGTGMLDFSFQFGWIVENATILSVIKYILMITGLTLILAIVYSFIGENKEFKIVLLISFLMPFIFAFLFNVSIFTINNHKFITMSLVFIDILTACFLTYLISKKIKLFIKIPIIIVLLLCLTATGISEFITYININKNYEVLNTNSEFVKWVKENTDKSDIFLTPDWVNHNFLLTGRSMYYGYVFFTWSAGYDVDTRYVYYRKLLEGFDNDKELFVNYCQENKIKYIIETDDLYYMQDEETGKYFYNYRFIHRNFPLVAKFNEEGIKIYQIYD